MDTLKTRRVQYLKVLQSVGGNPKVMNTIEELERELSTFVSKETCKDALARQYIRTGVMDGNISECSTPYKEVECKSSDLTNVEKYFNERNPHAIVKCFPPGEDDRVGTCRASLKPESLF